MASPTTGGVPCAADAACACPARIEEKDPSVTPAQGVLSMEASLFDQVNVGCLSDSQNPLIQKGINKASKRKKVHSDSLTWKWKLHQYNCNPLLVKATCFATNTLFLNVPLFTSMLVSRSTRAPGQWGDLKRDETRGVNPPRGHAGALVHRQVQRIDGHRGAVKIASARTAPKASESGPGCVALWDKRHLTVFGGI